MSAPKSFPARLKARRVKVMKWWRSPRMVDFRARRGAALVVFFVALFVSYGHIHSVTLTAGESAQVAVLMPFLVDALMLIGGQYIDRAKTVVGKLFAGLAFFGGFLMSLAANVLATQPTILGRATGVATAFALVVTAGVLHWGNKKPRPKRKPVQPKVSAVEVTTARSTSDRGRTLTYSESTMDLGGAPLATAHR